MLDRSVKTNQLSTFHEDAGSNKRKNVCGNCIYYRRGRCTNYKYLDLKVNNLDDRNCDKYVKKSEKLGYLNN